MLNVGVIGIGNAGSQIAALAKERLAIDVLAINSSEKDLQTIPADVPSLLIGDKKGAGKERRASKIFLKESIMKIINDEERSKIFDKDILFIISSTGGGTGSGSALMLTDILSGVCPADTIIIPVGILPTLGEGLSTQVNTLAYMKELYESLSDATYMLYDNEKLSKLSTPLMMDAINSSVVDDIDVIRGTYQLPTKYSSIDEKDMGRILSVKGRVVVASLRDIKEKDLDETTIEDMLIEQFKTNAHCELQRDKICGKSGIISNLSDRLIEKYNNHIPKVQSFMGEPVETFEHDGINADRHLPNSVFLVVSGLTQVNDRISKINDRIDAINEAQKQQEEASELNAVDFGEMNSKIASKKSGNDSDSVDLKDIFSKFGI